MIVSGGGTLDLERAVFRTPGVRALIVTSESGRELLHKRGVGALPSTEVRAMETHDGHIRPASILKLLHTKEALRSSATLWRTAASMNSFLQWLRSSPAVMESRRGPV